MVDGRATISITRYDLPLPSPSHVVIFIALVLPRFASARGLVYYYHCLLYCLSCYVSVHKNRKQIACTAGQNKRETAGRQRPTAPRRARLSPLVQSIRPSQRFHENIPCSRTHRPQKLKCRLITRPIYSPSPHRKTASSIRAMGTPSPPTPGRVPPLPSPYSIPLVHLLRQRQNQRSRRLTHYDTKADINRDRRRLLVG